MNSFAKALSKLTQVGVTMVVTIGMCFFIGKWLDKKLGTDVIFLAIFTLLGIGAAFRNLYVLVMLDFKKEEKLEEKQRELLGYKKNEK
ncbi:AtpZ/AtpI family protein [uncultured Tyzzerella sp.]|uniref:AtpZ/AtpI family protein n=1 Tax=uncultured Tyzzerella sp. TaxID=2321398 RepID=UPI0029432267|nr:AtpZ/AtpI family protein [uncultured Tyzzerella sp.]